MNSEDLAWALESGEIYGAGLDVITGEPHISPDHPLVKAHNCTSSPNFSQSTSQNKSQRGRRVEKTGSIEGKSDREVADRVGL